MLYYSTSFRGIGGRIRLTLNDFLVEEITPEGIIVNDTLRKMSRGDGPFTLAVLKKVSRDLLPTIAMLQRILDAKISFAGIKDRRAVTYQLVSINRPLLRFIKINSSELWSVGTSKWEIRLGELRGNRFTITIRDLSGENLPPDLSPYLSWTPGYFGHQRFGTSRPNTHKVGRFMVKGDYDLAIRELLAEPYDGEPSRIYSLRKALKETWDLESALASFPDNLIYEKRVIQSLLCSGADPLRALNALPRRLLRLFVDAYQSYLFNLALSERWVGYGLHHVDLGDVVAPLDNSLNPSCPIKATRSNIEKLRRLINTRRAVLLMPIPGSNFHIEGINHELYSKILDSEDLSSRDFSEVMGLTFRGALRPAVFYSYNLELLDRSPDELNPGKTKLTIRFSLPRGSYATVLLRELMKPEDPKKSGF